MSKIKQISISFRQLQFKLIQHIIKKLQNSMMHIILFLWVFSLAKSTSLTSVGFDFSGIKITSTNSSVRAIASYTFYLDRTITNNASITPWNLEIISTSSNITVSFPIQYNNITNVTCSNLSINDITVRNYICTKTTYNIILTNILTVDTYIKNVILTVSNVKNPGVGGQTNSFQGNIGSDIAKPDSSWSTVTLTAGSFDFCSAIYDNAYGNTTSNIIITVRTMDPSSSGNYMIVTFPYFWNRDLAQQFLTFPYNQDCSSTLSSNIYCNGSNSANGYPIVTAKNIFVEMTYFTVFKINNLLSPPTNQPTNLIKFESFNSFGKPIDQCSVYPTKIIQRQINNIIVNTLQTPFPSTNVGIQLTFNLPDYLNSNDNILLDFTSSYSPSFTYLNISSSSYFIYVNSASGNSLNFTFNRSVLIGQPIILYVYTIITPPSLNLTTPFQMSVQSYGYSKMKGYFGFTTQAATITGISLSYQVNKVSQSSHYTLNFTTPTTFLIISVVRIYFPIIMAINSSISAMSNGIPLTVNNLPNTSCLELSGFAIAPTSGSIVSIKFSNISNLDTTSPTQELIQVRTYRDSSIMDQMGIGSNRIWLNFTSVPSLQTQVQSSSNIVGQININLTFTVSNIVPLPMDTIIKLSYSNIQVSANPNITCLVNNIYSSCYQLSNIITITLNDTSINRRSTFLINIANYFINPPVTKTIASFQLTTYTPDAHVLEYMQVPVYLTNVNVPRPLSYFVLYSRTSQVNSATSTYTFAVSQFQPLLSSGINTLVLQLPSTLNTSRAQCNCIANLAAQTFTFAITNSFNQVTISNIINYYSTQPINSLSATIYLDSSFVYSTSSQLDNYIVNKQTSILPIASTTYSSGIYGQPTSITFVISYLITPSAMMRVTFPPSFDITSSTCTVSGATLNSSSIDNYVMEIDITGYTISTVTITISNVIAPKYASSLAINVQTSTTNNYSISQNDLPLWRASCTLPCRTCVATNLSQCLSCYADPTIVTEYLYDSTYKQCRDQCLQTQLVIGSTCVLCASPCYSCQSNSSNCMSCGAGYYFYYNQCLTACPDFYYKEVVGRVCAHCVTPCQTCVSETQCLSCQEGWYYYQSKCILSCPSLITISNITYQKCDICFPQCLTCSITASNCTSCITPLAMENNICVSQCSNNFYIYNSACVDSCQPPCSTCAIFATYCLSCASGYLYNNTCVPSCGEMLYISADNTQCLLCADLTIHCLHCQSPVICLICDPGYILFESQCLTSAPSGYVNISGVATLCDNQCVTCSILTDNCTSCRFDYYYNSLCVTTCPTSHYKFNHTCTRCVSPCNTCLDLNVCLSCIGTTNTFYIASNNTCSLTCPQYYFKNTLNSVCSPCQTPCYDCQSLTTCISCTGTKFLYNFRCLDVCPSGYFPNSTTNNCDLCISPCQTCNSIPSCLTCISGYYYLYPNQCVQACPSNYIANYFYQVCVNCTLPCLLCTQNECFKCQAPYINYNNSCGNSCPSTSYVVTSTDGSKTCALCPPKCRMCANESFCSSCAIGYFPSNIIAGDCVQSCPPQRPILKQNGCEPCQDVNCSYCYPNNECYQCMPPNILFKGFCLSSCPNGYILNISTDLCEVEPPPIPAPVNITVEPNYSVVITTPIYMIFCICGSGLSLIFILITCCLKLSPWPFLATAWAAPEIGALVVSTYAYHKYYVFLFIKDPIFGYVIISALGLFFIVNISVFCYSICVIFFNDDRFKRWKRHAACIQIIFLTFVQLITVINFKFHHLIWSGLKGTPKLESVSKLKYLTIFSAINLINSITFVAVYIFLINTVKQLFLLWLDALIVIVISAICSLLALKKDEKFFQQTLDNMILHRKHRSEDQFGAIQLKPTQRQQIYTPFTPSSKQIDQSYRDASSQTSSMFELKSISRLFIPSSARSSVKTSQSVQIAQNSVSTPKNREVSLQCSILSEGNLMSSGSSSRSQSQSSSKRYRIQCDYQSGTEYGNMGSADQSKYWDGNIHQPQYYKQKYNLNEAVFLDEEGKRVDMWDVSSNEAVIQENILDQPKQQKKQRQQQTQVLSKQPKLKAILMEQQDYEQKKQKKVENKQEKTQKQNEEIKENKQQLIEQKQIIQLKQISKQNDVKEQKSKNEIKFDISSISIRPGILTENKTQKQINKEQQQQQQQQQYEENQQGSQYVGQLSRKQQTIILKYKQILKSRLQYQSKQKEQEKQTNNYKQEQIDQQEQDGGPVQSMLSTNKLIKNKSILTHKSNKTILNNNYTKSFISQFKEQQQQQEQNRNQQQQKEKVEEIGKVKTQQKEKEQSQLKQQNEQILQQKQSQSQNRGDRFDNSVNSNHNGSISSSSHQYEQSQNSNHNGSLQLQQQEQQQQQQQKQKQQDEGDEEDDEDEEQEKDDDDDDDDLDEKQNNVEEQYNTSKKDTDPENQFERWQFLLNHTSNSNKNLAQQMNSEQIEQQQSIQKLSNIKQNSEENQNQQKPNLDLNLNMKKSKSKQKSKVTIRESNISKKTNKSKSKSRSYKQSINEGNNIANRQSTSKSKSKSISRSKSKSRGKSQKLSKQLRLSTGKQKYQQKQEQMIRNQSESEDQTDYLHSKMKKRQPKPDDHNKFAIKTKRKKRDEPRNKVVIVDSKKFTKLKKEATKLQKQIKQGEKLKQLISIQQAKLGGKAKKRTKDQQLKAIYMNPPLKKAES